MSTKKKQIFLSSRGVSLVELAFVIPITFLFIFAGVEFARSLRVKEIAQELSKEMASVLLRECVGYSTDQEVRECVDKYQGNFKKLANDLNPGSKVYASIFYYTDPATPPAVPPAPPILPSRILCAADSAEHPKDKDGYPVSYDYGSKIKYSSVSPKNCGTPAARGIVELGTSGGGLPGNASVVCVSEVYIPFVAVLSFIPGFFNYNPNSFYAITTM